MIISRQDVVALDLARLRSYVRRLGGVLGLDGHDFTVCLVDDREVGRLNSAYRGQARPTDVLSFPWKWERRAGHAAALAELKGYLGDVVISAETARSNARAEGHSTEAEVRWLILHGVLHLLGYDHEKDNGQMTALEHSLRAKLDIDGDAAEQTRSNRKSKVQNPKCS